MTYLYLILTTFFWAAVFYLGKYAIAYMSPLAAAAWRFIIAGVILICIMLLQKTWNGAAIRRNAWPLIAMGIIGVFGFNASLFYGLKLTSPVNGALIMAFNPAITALFAALLSGERIVPRQWLGFMISLTGVTVIVSGGSLHNLLTMSFSIGDLLILLGCTCWALYSVIPKRFITGLSTMLITTTTIVVGAIALTVVAHFASGDLLVMQSGNVIAAVIAMAVFGSVLAYIWWNQGIARIGAARAAIFVNLIPVFAALIGVALGQSLSGAQLLGATLVIIGVVTTAGVARPVSAQPSAVSGS